MTMDTTTRKMARKILSEKSAEAWLIAADVAEEAGDLSEAERLRTVGELVRKITDTLATATYGCYVEAARVERGVEVNTDTYGVFVQKRYSKVRIAVCRVVGGCVVRRYRLTVRWLTYAQLENPAAVYEKARDVIAALGIDTKYPALRAS